jgi:hypothetical protein
VRTRALIWSRMGREACVCELTEPLGLTPRRVGLLRAAPEALQALAAILGGDGRG